MSTNRKPRVFISRTTLGLKPLAEQVAEVLRQRGIEPIIQTGFYPSTHDVKGMLADHLQQCDAVICLIGSAYGSGPHDPITKAEQPVHGLKDPRTKDRLFSYTQLELLIARDLGRPIYTFFIEGNEVPTAFAPEPLELAQRQQTFITEFAKDGRNTYGTFSLWDQPADPPRGLKQAIETIKFEITVLAGKPTNLPYTSLGTLFKGRDEFLAELRQHLTAEGPVVIKGKRAIHGMGGVGKTRASIEYAWKHADDYRALLFISADTPEALHRNLAALCGPLVLNLPEQNEKEQALQVDAALRWLKLNRDWLLVVDNVDTDEAAEETKALLAKLTTGHVLITSRIADWTGHVKSLDLDVLSEAASIAFLDERTEERRPKKDDDREKAAALVQLLDCLALALEQAGAHLSTSAISYADYIALWESHRTDALAWHDEEKMKYPKSLAITYETSVAKLSEGAKELFHILSWFAPDPIPRSLLDTRPEPEEEGRHLGEIERLHLSRYLSDGKTFTIHRLNQEITRQQQKDSKPSLLFTSLEWVNHVMPENTDDVNTWPVASPIVSHATAISSFAIDHDIIEPSCRLLSCASLLMFAMGSYLDAETHMRRVVRVIETCYGPEAPVLATFLYRLSDLLRLTSRFDESETLICRALSIDEACLGKNHPDVARDLSGLGLLLYNDGRLLEAEAIMKRALAISEECLSASSPDLARDLMNLALVLQDTKRLAEAETRMRQALSVDEIHFGPNHPEVATDLGNLASLLRDMGHFDDAELLSRRAVAITFANFGAQHPKFAVQLRGLARLMKAANKIEEAEPLYRQSLIINESIFGASNPEVATDLGSLAQLLQASNRLSDAEPLYRRALAINERNFGDNHVDVASNLLNLAEFLHVEERFAEAEPLMRRAIAIYEAKLGVAHPDVATALSFLGLLLTDMKCFSEAESLLRRALHIEETCFGEVDPEIAITLMNLATIFKKNGRLTEAELLMRRAISIDETCLGESHPEVSNDLFNLATLLQESNRLSEAEPLMRRALAIDESHLGSDHPEVALDLKMLADLLRRSNSEDEAESLMQRATAIEKRQPK